MKRAVALYARLSVTTEESVSIERQLDSGRAYAKARGWEVVLEAVDDGVSATKNRPEDRVGWRKILDSQERFEAVIVWKVDRLARRVLDFLHADEALRARGAGIVAVEDPVDMTTAQGRAFATMLAVFGELEAAAISARVTAARRAIVEAGRRAGGRPPFGWRNVPNPDGPGYVLAQDPERIGVVRDLVLGALEGASLHSLARGLEARGVAPRARAGRKSGRWHEASVETILRAPAVAGMVPFRGDVLRDRDGLPVVDESVAVATPAERRRLLAVLDERKRPGSRPYGPAPALLAGLVRCGTCGLPMYRATSAAKFTYYRCQRPECPKRVGVSRPRVEEFVVERFLRAVGRLPVIERQPLEEDEAPALVEVEAAIQDTVASMAEDDADVVALAERLAALKRVRAQVRDDARAEPDVVEVLTGETFAQAWESLEGAPAARRALLGRALAAVVVEPTERRGNTLDPERVRLVWAGSPEAEALGV